MTKPEPAHGPFGERRAKYAHNDGPVTKPKMERTCRVIGMDPHRWPSAQEGGESMSMPVRCECCGRFIAAGDERYTADDVTLCKDCDATLVAQEAAQRRGEREEPA